MEAASAPRTPPPAPASRRCRPRRRPRQSQLRRLHQAARNTQRLEVRVDQRPAAVLCPPVQPDRGQILYPVVQGVLDQYKSVYDAAKTPLVHSTSRAKARRSARWRLDDRPKRGHRLHRPGRGPRLRCRLRPGDRARRHHLERRVAQPVLRRAVRLGHRTRERHGRCRPDNPGRRLRPGRPAAAPAVGTATAGNASATVTWTAPADGGSAITGYTVHSSAATSPPRCVPDGQPGHGDRADQRHRLHVQGGRDQRRRTGPASAPSNSVTPAATPGRADHRHRHRAATRRPR